MYQYRWSFWGVACGRTLKGGINKMCAGACKGEGVSKKAKNCVHTKCMGPKEMQKMEF